MTLNLEFPKFLIIAVTFSFISIISQKFAQRDIFWWSSKPYLAFGGTACVRGYIPEPSKIPLDVSQARGLKMA